LFFPHQTLAAQQNAVRASGKNQQTRSNLLEQVDGDLESNK